MMKFLDTSKPTLGLGCWAIGGPFSIDGVAKGWGEVDDAVSTRAIALAIEHGVGFFDTAQAYGTGHSETVLGAALKTHPDVAIATKIGHAIDPATRELTGNITDPVQLRDTIDASRRRLQRDHIDLILLHINAMPVDAACPTFDMLADLHAAGTIGGYGWSTDFPDRTTAFADQPGFVAIEHAMNVFFRADHLVPTVEDAGLTGLIRSPLAMGVLGGRYDASSVFRSDDVRGNDCGTKAYFSDGRVADAYLSQLNAVREELTSGGRSLAQGAISWLWARSQNALPIPGFRTPEQVGDLCAALDHGPLTTAQMESIEAILDRPPEGPPSAR